jgi:hypothetical protein
METVKTKKGTVLPLMNLKGKPYMAVAHRIVWFNEDTEGGSFSMETEQLVLSDERAVIKATVKVFNKEGNLVKQGVGTKSESKKDFPDFIEKAETGAIGRAITMLGYGTAYAIADLDEGARIIDSPVAVASPKFEVKKSVEPVTASVVETQPQASFSTPVESTSSPVAPAKKKSMFQKPGVSSTSSSDGAWS